MYSQAETAAPARSRRLFDLLNVPLFAFAAICFLLPLCELNCGQIKVKFTGPNLAWGTDPEVVGASASETRGFAQREKIPQDTPLTIMPILALAGAACALMLFLGRGPAQPAASACVAAAALLVLMLAIYAAAGFGIERKVAEQKTSRGRDADIPISTEKTAWFYLAFVASGAAFIFASMRKRSPMLEGRASRQSVATAAASLFFMISIAATSGAVTTERVDPWIMKAAKQASMAKNGQWAYRELARVQYLAGDWEGARKSLLAGAEGSSRDPLQHEMECSFNVYCAADADDIETAKSWARQAGTQNSGRFYIACHLARSGKTDLALQLVESCSEYKCIGYNDVAMALAENGNVPAGKQALDLARKAMNRDDARLGFPPNRGPNQQMFPPTLAALGDAGAAKSEAQNLPDLNIRVGVYISISSAQYKRGDTAGAQATLAAARMMAEAIMDVKGRSHAYVSMLQVQCLHGDLAGANTTATLIIESGWDGSSAFHLLGDKRAEAGDLPGAKLAFERAASAYRATTQETQKEPDISYSIALARTGHLAEAKAALQKLPDGDAKARLAGSVAVAMAKAGDLAGVQALQALISGQQDPLALYQEIAEAIIRNGGAPDSVQLLNQGIEDPQGRCGVYLGIARGLLKDGPLPARNVASGSDLPAVTPRPVAEAAVPASQPAASGDAYRGVWHARSGASLKITEDKWIAMGGPVQVTLDYAVQESEAGIVTVMITDGRSKHKAALRVVGDSLEVRDNGMYRGTWTRATNDGAGSGNGETDAAPKQPAPSASQPAALTPQELLKSAQAGDATAQLNLGDAYLKGDGVAKDAAQAAKWYRKAADQGVAKAESSLGYLYYSGTGAPAVPRDRAEGLRWLQKAARDGSKEAQDYLKAHGQSW